MRQRVYKFDSAIVRRPSRSVIFGLRDKQGRNPEYETIQSEHDRYVNALLAAGIKNLHILPAQEDFPDSVFIADAALVFAEGAVLLRSGAPSRRAEPLALAPDLEKLFDTVIEVPEGGYVDGSDVLATSDKVMIGLSPRTNLAGAELLCASLERLGKCAEIVHSPKGVLHFKTACALLDDSTVLLTPQMAEAGIFDSFDQIITPEGEEVAANALRVNRTILINDDCPRTQEMLERRRYNVVPLPTTEVRLLDGGLACMSLRWKRA